MTRRHQRQILTIAAVVVIGTAGVGARASLHTDHTSTGVPEATLPDDVAVNTADTGSHCRGQEKSVDNYGEISGVAESVSAPAATVERWQETRNGGAVAGVRSPLRDEVDDTSVVYVCDYLGAFVGPTPPGVAQYTIADLVFAPDQRPILDSEGHTDQYASFAAWLKQNG